MWGSTLPWTFFNTCGKSSDKREKARSNILPKVCLQPVTARITGKLLDIFISSQDYITLYICNQKAFCKVQCSTVRMGIHVANKCLNFGCYGVGPMTSLAEVWRLPFSGLVVACKKPHTAFFLYTHTQMAYDPKADEKLNFETSENVRILSIRII